MSILRRMLAGEPPPPMNAPHVAPGEPGVYGLGVGMSGAPMSAPPAPIATVAAIIAVISQTCGQLPRRVQRDDLRDRTPVDRSRFRHLVGKPNRTDAMRGNTFWEAVFASVEGWGNGYIWPDRIAQGWRGVLGLYFLMPQRVMPERVGNGVRYVLDGNRERFYGPGEIAHIAKNMTDGVSGMSPVRAGAMTHSLAQVAELTALSFFRRGTTVGGVVMNPERMEEAAVEEFYDRFNRYHQGGRNISNVLLLEGNAKFERIGIPPIEAQFLETRQFEREEILSWYAPGMPHHLLGWRSAASNWGTGVEQQSIAFVKYVLLSRLRRVEELVSEEWLPPDLRFEFDVTQLLRGDSKMRSEMWTRMRQWGIVSADEWRAAEGMGPREIADDYLEPVNMKRIEAEEQGARRPRMAPPQEAVLVGEMRCSNPACPRVRSGGKGKLLARNVGSAEVLCPDCGEVTALRAGQVLRDAEDIVEALAEDLAGRIARARLAD